MKLYEAGETVAAHVRDWGHVRLFSPWRFNTDAAATAILREHGWQAPPADALPTGGDLYSAYLQPLAETPPLKSVIETGARVRNVSRAGIDKVVSRGRGDHPFALSIDTADGASRIELARAVIDASGTWASPNPAAASGTPAHGEVTFADRIAYGIPDVLGRDQRDVCRAARARHRRRAFCRKCRCSIWRASPKWIARTKILWAVRAGNLARVFGGGAADKLAARGALGDDLKRLVESGKLEFGFELRRRAYRTAWRRADGIRPIGPRTRAGGLASWFVPGNAPISR